MTDESHRDRNNEVVTAVLRASRALVGVSARSLAEVEDTLTMTQFRTLVVLSEDVSLSLNLLANRLGVAPSSALRTIDRLSQAGLASRTENPENRREVQLSLTPTGEHIVTAVTTRRRLEIARIIARMTPQAADDLIEAFRGFATAAGETDATNNWPSSLGW